MYLEGKVVLNHSSLGGDSNLSLFILGWSYWSLTSKIYNTFYNMISMWKYTKNFQTCKTAFWNEVLYCGTADRNLVGIQKSTYSPYCRGKGLHVRDSAVHWYHHLYVGKHARRHHSFRVVLIIHSKIRGASATFPVCGKI